MKKTTLLLMFMSAFWTYAQVSSYSFSQASETYIAITGGTSLGSTLTASGQFYVDPAKPQGGGAGQYTGPGMDIGFDFTFNGFVYNKFGVNSNGYISLGSSAVTPSVNMFSDFKSMPLSVKTTVPDDLVARISALSAELIPNTINSTLTYKTIGSSPNKVLVIQWENFRKSGGTGDSFNFQIRLHETTNVVSIAYGAFSSNSTANKFQVGLRAAPTETPSNFVNRTSATSWNATTQGISASDTVLMSDVLTPSNGLTFSWTPPVCGGATGLVANAISANAATLTWNAGLPAPAEGYEYIVSSSAAFPVVSGTPINNSTVTVASLTPNSVYYIFLRSNCGTAFTPWSLGGSFRTKCTDITSFSENFDSYEAGTSSAPILPACWESTGTAEVNISNTNPASGTKSLMMRATAVAIPAVGTVLTISYAILPPVSNLGVATHRLKFKATSNVADKVLEIGYLTDPMDPNSFISLESKTVGLPISGAIPVEYYVTPPALPGVKNLVFKNATATTTGAVFIYIDDVVWEPIPSCLDITALAKVKVVHNSIAFKWTKSSSNETEWQYVYGPAATTANPDSLTPINVLDNPTATIADILQPQTTYNIWVRSACHSSFGLWIGPLVVTTGCTPASQFIENFDVSATLPFCWNKMGSTGTVTVIASSTAPSPANVLTIHAGSTTQMATVALPLLNNATVGTHRLRFKAKTNVAGAKMDIGYLADIDDLNTYAYLQTVIINSNTTFDEYIASLGSSPKSQNLVFRNPGDSNAYIYIDEVVWEPIPTCADITALAAIDVSNTTATIGWTPGASQNAWQYARGDANASDPSSLVAVNLASPEVTITGLSSSTTYKVWVRSKCSTSFGAWFGPVVFATSCPSTTVFSQNFDASDSLPSCWTKVGGLGNVLVNNTASQSNTLVMSTLAPVGFGTEGPSVVAMPPVSNATLGTHRLRFKVKATTTNRTLQVGYLTNFADPSSFAPLYTYTVTQSTSFESLTVELGTEPTTDYLAFRVQAPSATATFYIDDVIWERIPACADVSNVLVTNASSTTAAIVWTKGASETAWQYVKGNVTVTDPGSLIPVNVTTNPSTTITGLDPFTTYKVWVRSNCGSGKYGYWSEPITLKTACSPVSAFAENFDAVTSLPDCWTNLSAGGTATIVNSATLQDATVVPLPSSSLLLYNQYPYHSLVVGMKPVNNAGAGTHRLKFKYNSNFQGRKFDVGYLKNPADASSFELLTTITTKTAVFLSPAFETIKINDIGGKPDVNQVLAFRIPLNSGGTEIYIDELVWEPLPTCLDVSAVKIPSYTASTAKVEWASVGSENQWQVSVRPASEAEPDAASALTANTIKSLEVPGLNPSSTYKVWVRSSCGDAKGDWIGPVLFNTECIAATTLNENFNSAPSYPELPVCWSKIMKNALPGSFVQLEYRKSNPFIVSLMSNYSGTSSQVILVSPRISNLSSGTLKLMAGGGTAIEVGTLNNTGDAAVFTKKQELTLSDFSTNAFSVSFSTPTTDQYIGIRLKTTGGSNQYAIVDNITWEPNALSNDQFDLSQFSYYPNPVKDVLNISYINNISGVTVYNLLGQEVVSKTMNENLVTVDLSSLTKGTYLVKVTSDNQVKTIKVIKE